MPTLMPKRDLALCIMQLVCSRIYVFLHIAKLKQWGHRLSNTLNVIVPYQ